MMKTSHKSLLRAPVSVLKLVGGLGLVSLAGVCAPVLAAAPIVGDISVNIGIDAGPPPPRHEVIVERTRPGPDYVWVNGYYDGTPGHYTWVAGHWDRPPHPHATWVEPRWERDHDGHYHMIRGEWR